MKKAISITALILAAALIAFSLCSCGSLDVKRAHHAVYTDDTKKEILLNGQTFKALDTRKLECVFIGSYDYSYYVTSKDVPVLLSSFEGDYISVNNEETLIITTGDPKGEEWYVREDLFDSYKSALDKSELSRYFLSYDEESTEGYFIRQKNILIDEETSKAIGKTLSISDKEKISYKELSEGDYSQKIITLRCCDENMYITDPDINISLIMDNGKYYVWNGNVYNEKTICPVSEEDVELIKKLFTDYPGAAEEFNIRYSFENDYYYKDYNEYNHYDEPNNGKAEAVKETTSTSV